MITLIEMKSIVLTETQDREGEDEEELLDNNDEELEAGTDHNDIE